MCLCCFEKEPASRHRHLLRAGDGRLRADQRRLLHHPLGAGGARV